MLAHTTAAPPRTGGAIDGRHDASTPNRLNHFQHLRASRQTTWMSSAILWVMLRQKMTTPTCVSDNDDALQQSAENVGRC
jgi:hypothetical protein